MTCSQREPDTGRSPDTALLIEILTPIVERLGRGADAVVGQDAIGALTVRDAIEALAFGLTSDLRARRRAAREPDDPALRADVVALRRILRPMNQRLARLLGVEDVRVLETPEIIAAVDGVLDDVDAEEF
jgi:hypothetical protein